MLDTITQAVTRPTYREIVDWCRDYVARTLDVPMEKVDPNAEFDALGFDSAAAVALVVDVGTWLDIDLEPASLFDFPTISAFAEHLSKQ
jgi:acyl carrier protein